jgi:TfoX/Sxy family transcriptional regulator of competence genes
MPVSASFRIFVVDQLSRVAPRIRAKSMFGGVGIYSRELFFALIAEDELYLKVDDTNRADFEARGAGPFRPYGPDGEAMQYYRLPPDVLEDGDALRVWVEKSVAVAQRKRSKPRPRRKPFSRGER